MATPPAPLQLIHHPLLSRYGVERWCTRDDLIHPAVSGNEWRKLKYHLLHAQMQGKQHRLSLGGAYSRHIQALATAGRQYGPNTSGIIRGQSSAVSNSTLMNARRWGMDLFFVDRQSHRRRQVPGWPGSKHLIP